MSLLEAAASGKPMIATDAPGCREIVIDGQTGLLVPIEDAKALAEAIARLAGSPAWTSSIQNRPRRASLP